MIHAYKDCGYGNEKCGICGAPLNSLNHRRLGESALVHPDASKVANVEPPWIRDITACPKNGAQIAFLFDDDKRPGSAEKIAALCDGERYFCEFCGAGFPLWPTSEWASHVMQTHANDLTLQQAQGILQLCSEGLTDHTKQFLSLQMMSRVILRRRAHEMKMLVLLDARGKIIEDAPGFVPRIQ